MSKRKLDIKKNAYIQVPITPEDKKAFELWCDRNSTTMAEVIRSAISPYIAETREERSLPESPSKAVNVLGILRELEEIKARVQAIAIPSVPEPETPEGGIDLRGLKVGDRVMVHLKDVEPFEAGVVEAGEKAVVVWGASSRVTLVRGEPHRVGGRFSRIHGHRVTGSPKVAWQDRDYIVPIAQ